MDQQDFSLKWSVVPFQFLIGLVFIIFTIPGFLRFAAHQWVSNELITRILEQLADTPESVYSMLGSSDGDLFATLLRFSIYGVGFYLIGVSILALRKWELYLIPAAILGLITGALAIAIMLWTFTILLWLGQAIIALVILLWPYLKILFYVIAGLVALYVIGAIFVGLWQEFGIWGIIGLLVFGVVIWFAWPYIWLVIVWFVGFILKNLPWILGIGIALAILLWLWHKYSFPGALVGLILVAIGWFVRSTIYTVLLWLYQEIFFPILVVVMKALLWLGGLLVVIFSFLFRALILIAFVLMGIGIVAFLGNLLLDDLRAAWNGGSGMKGVLLASFGIGLAISLILLASSGSSQNMTLVDQIWNSTVPIVGNFSPMGAFLEIMPTNFRLPLQTVFSDAGVPIFDVVVLSAVLGFSYVGLIRGLRQKQDDNFHVSFFGKEAALLAIGVPLVFLIVIGAAMLPSED